MASCNCSTQSCADSGCQTQQSYTLTINKNPTAGGTVSSSDSGISCGSTCSKSYTSGTTVTLAATPLSGYTFWGWTGACTGTGSCVISMTSAKYVQANFTVTAPSTYALAVTSSGASSVAITGSSATYSGTANYLKSGITSGTNLTLTAPATSGGYSFSSWSGCNSVSGTGNRTCNLAMSADKSVNVFYTATAEPEEEIDVPTVTTNSATSITTTSTTLRGNIDSTGGSSVLEKGFDWGTSSGSLVNYWTTTGTYSTGSFTKYLSGLTPGAKYYYKAKARNSAGW
ncbi:MAG: hypothetical protein ISS83_01990, partial [Candidatus Pacebacteria bacterium]|nr:hypothetical protein [Candidatus Paceibacterota bacterium]